MTTLWPFTPNWSQPFKVSYEFRTEIIVSRSGKEQRRALRATPRRRFEYQALAEGARLRTLDRLAASRQDDAFLLPEFPRGVRGNGIPASGDTLTVAEIPDWLETGATIALVHGRRAALREVDSISGLDITFTATEATPWPAGVRLCPVVEGRPGGEISTRRQTSDVSVLSVEFAATPAVEPVDEGAAGPLFNGREVFLKKPDWSRPVRLDYLHEVETVDFGRGRTAVFSPLDFGAQTRSAVYLNRSFDEAEELRRFFARMKGQRGEFYMPTWRNDLPLKTTALSGADTLRVEGTEAADAYADDSVHRAVMVAVEGQAPFYRLVEDIGPSAGDTVVQIDGTWPFDLPPETTRVSWLHVCRFATDTLMIEWLTTAVAQAQLSIRTLEALEPET